MVETVVSIASLLISIGSLVIAGSSLRQAKLAIQEQKQGNAQTHMDWAQRKWYDLYFKAEQARTALEEYQAAYGLANLATPSVQQMRDHNRIMSMFRELIAIGTVFPKNPALDELFGTMDFSIPSSALSKERLTALADAIELLRQKALVNKRVLDVLTD